MHCASWKVSHTVWHTAYDTLTTRSYYKLSSDPSFIVFGTVLPNPKFPSLSEKFVVIPIFCVFYAVHFATNIKTPRLSKLCKFCSEYQNVANVATIFGTTIKTAANLNNTTNFKTPQIICFFKCDKFQSVTNVPFYSYFVLLFLLLSYFHPSFLIFQVLISSYFFA